MRKVVNLNLTPSNGNIFTQLLISIGIVMLFALAAAVFGIMVAALITGEPAENLMVKISQDLKPETLNAFKIIQVFSQIGTFLVPALLLPLLLFKVDPYKYTGLTGRSSFILYFLALICFFALFPVLELMIRLNQQMQLPAFLEGVENWMREKEDTNGRLTGFLLHMPTFNHFLSNIFVIAILPAVAEELFFRGFLQRTFYNWWRKKHLAVILSSVIFSAIHIQFFGFFPRLFLGLFLGYLLLWSGDLKLSIFVHFLNNFTSLLIAYLYRDEHGNFDVNSPVTEYPAYIYIFSALLGGFLLHQIFRYSRKKRTMQEENLPIETGEINWAKAFSSQSIYEAEIVSGNLQSEGIHAVVFNKKDSSYGFGIVEVHVHAEDLERAQYLISSFKL